MLLPDADGSPLLAQKEERPKPEEESGEETNDWAKYIPKSPHRKMRYGGEEMDVVVSFLRN